jgi:hypothetical protein
MIVIIYINIVGLLLDVVCVSVVSNEFPIKKDFNLIDTLKMIFE